MTHTRMGVAPRSNTHRTLGALVTARAEEAPEHLVYRFLLNGEADGPVATLTRGGLLLRAQAAAALLQAEAPRGTPVLLLFPPGLAFIEAFFACQLAGMPAVPVWPPDPLRPERSLARLRAVLLGSGARLALTTALGQSLMAGCEEAAPLRWIVIDTIDDAAAGGFRAGDGHPDDVALLQYTSGSTGRPRGVAVTHANLLANAAMIRHTFAEVPAPVGVSWLPVYHDMGLIGHVITPLFVGGPNTFLSPLDFLSRPMRWLEALHRYQASITGGPNFAYDLVARRATPEDVARLDLRHLRVVFCGAETVRASTLRRFASMFAPAGLAWEALRPVYGLAEATLLVTHPPAGRGPHFRRFDAESLRRGVAHPADADGVELVGLGHAASGTEVRITDPQSGHPLPEGTIGEIQVSGPHVAAGYLHAEADTAATFVPAPDGRVFLRTGDLGFLDDGELFFSGRSKEIILIRGRNHHPVDLEAAVEEAHPAIRRGGVAALALREGPDAEEQLGVVAEIDPRRLTDPPERVIAAVRDALARSHDVAAAAVGLVGPGVLPRTSSGKLQRLLAAGLLTPGHPLLLSSWRTTAPDGDPPDLQDPGVERDGSGETGERVRAVARAFLARRLGIPPADIRDDTPLSQVGLDSLLAAELASVLAQALGRPVDPAAAWTWPTLDALARGLSAGTPEPAPLRIDLRRCGPGPGEEGPLWLSELDLYRIMQHDARQEPYNLFLPLRISAPPDTPRLRRALALLIQRHEALRTGFVDRDGHVRRRIAAAAELDLVVRVAHGLDEAGRAQAIRALCDATRHHVFDLSGPPLLSAALLDLGDQGFLALLISHLIADGWSLGLLLGELAALYAALGRGEAAAEAELPPLQLQLSDYAVAAEEFFRDLSARGAGAYPPWPETRYRLPLDTPLPAQPSIRGAVFDMSIDAAQWARARAAAAAANLPAVAAMLVAFQYALHRHGRRTDVAFTVVRGNRERPEVRPLIGLLALADTCELSLRPGDTWADLLTRTRPFLLGEDRERMAHESLAHPPSGRVLFNFFNFDAAAGPQTAPFSYALEEARYPYVWATHDILYQVFQVAGGLRCRALYRSEVLREETLSALGGYVMEALLAMIQGGPVVIPD